MYRDQRVKLSGRRDIEAVAMAVDHVSRERPQSRMVGANPERIRKNREAISA